MLLAMKSLVYEGVPSIAATRTAAKTVIAMLQILSPFIIGFALWVYYIKKLLHGVC